MCVGDVVEQDVQETVAAGHTGTKAATMHGNVSSNSTMPPAQSCRHSGGATITPTHSLGATGPVHCGPGMPAGVLIHHPHPPAVHCGECPPDPLPLLVFIVGQVGVGVLQEGDGHQPDTAHSTQQQGQQPSDQSLSNLAVVTRGCHFWGVGLHFGSEALWRHASRAPCVHKPHSPEVHDEVGDEVGLDQPRPTKPLGKSVQPVADSQQAKVAQDDLRAPQTNPQSSAMCRYGGYMCVSGRRRNAVALATRGAC